MAKVLKKNIGDMDDFSIVIPHFESELAKTYLAAKDILTNGNGENHSHSRTTRKRNAAEANFSDHIEVPDDEDEVEPKNDSLAEGLVDIIFFECKEKDCYYYCEDQKALDEHAKSHKKTDLHKCNLCECSFPNKTQLKNHGSEHKKKRGGKPGECTKCNSSSNSSSKRGGNKSISNPSPKDDKKSYSCIICKVKCSSKDALSEHLKGHRFIK